jgi:putative tryptophan/tyrosine transport system substrate-binding protein
MRRVSLLLALDEDDPEMRARAKAFRTGMRDFGWIEGRNVHIEYRYAGVQQASISTHVADLVRLAPDVIVANSSPVVAALQRATNAIPIIFAVVNDPVGQGFISNLMRPGGNITGFSFIEPAIVGKWTSLLADVKPNLSRAALMFNPDTAPYYDAFLRLFEASPQRASIKLDPVHVRSVAEIEKAVAELGREPGSSLIAASDPYILGMRATILRAANQHGVAVMSPYKQFVVEGTLMSYGPDASDIFRRSSSYVDRVLKGESPGNLPSRPTSSSSPSTSKQLRPLD